MPTSSPRLDRLRERLSVPVDGASLAVWRIAFGAIIAWETMRYFAHGWIARYYIEPVFHFTYYGFGWVHPWPAAGMYLHFALLGAVALLAAAGVWYRATSVLLWLGFTYVFLLDEARYLNHFYAASLLALLLAVVPAARCWSVDEGRRRRASDGPSDETVPTWSLWLLRAQVGLMYFFGGVAKINPDWIHGEPMRSWLLQKSNVAIIDWIVRSRLELFIFSYGGLAFDLFVVPALLWKRTRPYAFVVAIVFHVINSQLFSIGIFPWMMIAATTLFFEPDWPRRLWAFVRRRPRPIVASAPPNRAPVSMRALALIGVYLLLQVLIPVRRVLYPGNVSWTEEGHRFSWQMKLRDKDGVATFLVADPRSGTVREVRADTIINGVAAGKMATRPDMILQFAHYLARTMGTPGHPVQVRVRSSVSLNGHESRPLVDSTVDLAMEQRTLWPARWITRGPDLGDDDVLSSPEPESPKGGTTAGVRR